MRAQRKSRCCAAHDCLSTCDANFLPRYSAPCLLSGAAADQQRRPHRDERPGRLRAGREQGVCDARRDNLRPRIRVCGDARGTVDGQGRPPARIHDRLGHRGRRRRHVRACAVARELCAVLLRHRGDRHLHGVRAAVSLCGGRGGRAGIQGQGHFAGAGGRHSRGLSGSSGEPLGKRPAGGSFPGFVSGSVGHCAGCARRPVASARTAAEHGRDPRRRTSLGADRASAGVHSSRRCPRRWATAS